MPVSPDHGPVDCSGRTRDLVLSATQRGQSEALKQRSREAQLKLPVAVRGAIAGIILAAATLGMPPPEAHAQGPTTSGEQQGYGSLAELCAAFARLDPNYANTACKDAKMIKGIADQQRPYEQMLAPIAGQQPIPSDVVPADSPDAQDQANIGIRTMMNIVKDQWSQLLLLLGGAGTVGAGVKALAEGGAQAVARVVKEFIDSI